MPTGLEGRGLLSRELAPPLHPGADFRKSPYDSNCHGRARLTIQSGQKALVLQQTPTYVQSGGIVFATNCISDRRSIRHGACQRPARFVQSGNQMASSALCKVTTIGKSHCKFPKFMFVSFPDCNGPHPVGKPCRSCRPLAKVPNSDACHSIG